MTVAMITPDLIQCSLCLGMLPASQGEVFQGHMQDQHRAYFDLDFMFAVFCLSAEKKVITLDFIHDQLKKETLMDNSDLPDVKNTYKDPSVKVNVNLPGATTISLQDISIHNFQESTRGPEEIEKSDENDSSVGEKKQNDIKDNSLKSEKKRYTRRKPQKPQNTSGVCKDCGEFKKHLKHHRKREHGTVSICDLCNAKLNSIVKLRDHKRRFHKPYSPCPECGKFVKRLTLHLETQHTKNEDKKWKCLTCGKGFADKYSLIEHELIHGEKMYPCRVSNGLCGKASKSPGNRTKHEALCKYWELLDMKMEDNENKECKLEVKSE